MKNTKSTIIKSLVFSGIVLGTIGLQSTIVDAATNAGIDAATNVTDTTTNKITNQIVFTNGDVEVGNAATIVTGTKVGQVIDLTKQLPAGYQVASGNNNYTLGKDGAINRVELTKVGNVTATVHYIYNSGQVGSEVLTGNAGDSVSVSKVPAGYYLANKSQNKVILGSGSSDVYLNVNPAIHNTISFVQDNTAKTEVGTTTISGEASGDKVTLASSSLPAGYTLKNADDSSVTMQPDGSKQQITVVASSKTENFKGAVGTMDKLVSLYSDTGAKLDARSLGADSSWATDKKLTLNGDTYYRVSTSEWVKGSDVYSYTSNPTTVVTKDGSISHLYDATGKVSPSRSVSANSAWYSDRTTMINGQKYYRVSTNEWLSANDVK